MASAVAHFSAIIETVPLALHCDVAGGGMSGSRRTGANHDQGARRCIVRVIDGQSFQAHTRGVVTCVCELGELARLGIMRRWNDIIEVATADVSITHPVQELGDVGIALAIGLSSCARRPGCGQKIVHLALLIGVQWTDGGWIGGRGWILTNGTGSCGPRARNACSRNARSGNACARNACAGNARSRNACARNTRSGNAGAGEGSALPRLKALTGCTLSHWILSLRLGHQHLQEGEQ